MYEASKPYYTFKTMTKLTQYDKLTPVLEHCAVWSLTGLSPHSHLVAGDLAALLAQQCLPGGLLSLRLSETVINLLGVSGEIRQWGLLIPQFVGEKGWYRLYNRELSMEPFNLEVVTLQSGALSALRCVFMARPAESHCIITTSRWKGLKPINHCSQ